MSHPARRRPSPLYQLPGRPIAYFPAISPHVGGVKAAILLCQLVYWTPRAKDRNGWIYKSQLEIMQETGLSRHEQRAARQALIRLGLLEERYDRLEHQLYVRVVAEAYNALIVRMHESQGSEALPPKGLKVNHVRKSDMAIYGFRTSGDPEIGHGDIRNSDIAKSFSEIPESTTEMAPVLAHDNGEAMTQCHGGSQCPGVPGNLSDRYCDVHVEALVRDAAAKLHPLLASFGGNERERRVIQEIASGHLWRYESALAQRLLAIPEAVGPPSIEHVMAVILEVVVDARQQEATSRANPIV